MNRLIQAIFCIQRCQGCGRWRFLAESRASRHSFIRRNVRHATRKIVSNAIANLFKKYLALAICFSFLPYILLFALWRYFRYCSQQHWNSNCFSAIIRMYSSCADIKEIIPYFLIPFQANTTGKCLRFNLLNIYKKSKFFRNNIPVNWKIYLKSLHPCIEIKTFIQYNQY